MNTTVPLTRRAFLRGACATAAGVLPIPRNVGTSWLAPQAAHAVRRALAGGVPDALGATPGPGRSGRWWSSLVWGVLENHAFAQVADLPSHRRLAREGTVLTQYFAVGHPSGPNYRAMISGETWGSKEVVDTFHPSISTEARRAVPPIPTFVYHLAGEIARRHNPFADLHAPVERVRHGLNALAADLRGGLPEAAIVYVGWDDDNDMHDGDLGRGDRNLSALLDTLGSSPWFVTPDRSGRYPAFFLCYDEDDGRDANRVFAAWWGRGVRPAAVSGARHKHFGFCRTITENWGLPALGRAALEPPIDEVWV